MISRVGISSADSLDNAALLRKIKEACRSQGDGAFRDGILTAVRAAEEPDPFLSIRGEFDLSDAGDDDERCSYCPRCFHRWERTPAEQKLLVAEVRRLLSQET